MKIDRSVLRTIKHDRDVIAAVLSVIPGLGQVYKGHYTAGVLTLLLGVPLVIWAGILLSLATFGAGLLLLPACWAAVAFNAYCAKDHRKHHALSVL